MKKISLLASTLFLASSSALAGYYVDDVNGCSVYYIKGDGTYTPKNHNITFTWSGKCENGFARGSGTLEWYVAGNPAGKFIGQMGEAGKPGDGTYYWPGEPIHVGGYDFNEYNQAIKRKSERAIIEEKAQIMEKIRAFRGKIALGDMSTLGLVLEVKGELVKIQVEESQCTQRGQNGECLNYINSIVQKWVKRDELYPTR